MTKSSGPTSSGEEDVRKGAWTAEEDEKLRAYIEKNGTGHWRSVGRKAGLQRCGKSCRLRWTNYLRPDIKHGSFTPEEEKLIIEQHLTMGSRWSQIASKLPGRTDNDIKNHWNTRLRKKLVDMGIDPVTHKPISEILRNMAGNMANCKSGPVPKLMAEARRCFGDATINKALQDYMLPQSGSSNATAVAAGQEMEAKMERADIQGPLHALPTQAADNLVTFARMPDMATFCPGINTALSSNSDSFSDGSDVDTQSSGGVTSQPGAAAGSSLSSRRRHSGNGGQQLSIFARRGLAAHSIVIDSDDEIESPRRAVPSGLEPSVLNRKMRLVLREAMTQGVGLRKRTAETCSTSEASQAGSNKRHHRDLVQCQDFQSQHHQQLQQQQQQQQQQHLHQHHTLSFMGSSPMSSCAMVSGYGGFQSEAMTVAAPAPLPAAEAGFGMGEEQGMSFSAPDFASSHLVRSSGQEGYAMPAASSSDWSEESLRQLLEPSSGFWNVEQQHQGRGSGSSQARTSSGNASMPINDTCSLWFIPRGGDGSAPAGAQSTSLPLDSPMGAARCVANVVDDIYEISPLATPRSWAGSFPTNVASETHNSRLQQQQASLSSTPDIPACWQDGFLSTPKSMGPDMAHFDLPSPKLVPIWAFHD